MSYSRRNFLKAGSAAAMGLGVLPHALDTAPAPTALGAPVGRADRALRLLILGGTGFTGPYQVRYAVERGHQVSIFNRGRREADIPDGVEWLIGDRNGDLKALEGRDWDVVIDVPTSLPKWVRDAASLLQGHAGQYVFISTISVYSDNSKPGMDETTALERYQGADPYAEERITGETYGALKALSEQEAEKWFPGKTTVIRPGLIVGPGDPTDRFTYWPVRIRRGGEVLAPGDPTDPVQIIDARDLAEWVIRMAEKGQTGIYNATGPEAPMSIAEMLYGIRAVTGGDVRFTWADADFLAEHEVRPWADMPVWIPPRDGNEAFADVSIDRALAQGLTFRPLADTVRDLLAWHDQRPEDQRGPTLRAGLSPEREAEVLAALHARAG